MNADHTPPAAIELINLTRRFGRTVAVDDVTLGIPAGTTCGFIGLNGAGNTTTLRMLVGLLAPTAGAIRVAGCPMPAEHQLAKLRIGYVPDRPTVYSWMRVREAVAFCRSLYGPAWNQPRCDEVMKTLRLPPDRRVKHLSKGEGAKLSLLLAIGHDPEVLILDEPTGGFDVLARDEFLEGLLNVTTTQRDTGRARTVLFSSHALGDVQRLADSVAILHQGKLLLHRPLEQFLETTKRIRSVLEESTATVAPPGTVHQRISGREWIVTVKDFSPDQVEFIRSKNHVQRIDVMNVTLDEAFRDYVRGEESPETEAVMS
ncbi:MAG TPA: ABC transporter ATP-binding protein [Tepidisphaeraceae bacterium]|nr:ABC transporter ATP-binding protein [Tepidisphaeraceae bacterium]